MEWLCILALAIGVPLTVPAALQARDGERTGSSLDAFAGIALVAFGGIGLVALAFSANTPVTLVASSALGLAAGALHPEILALLANAGRGAADPPELHIDAH